MSRLEYVAGTEIVDDIRLGHFFHEVEIIKHIIRITKPRWFIEIGIHEGGLSYLLIPSLPPYQYVGIEIDYSIIRPEVIELYKNQVLVKDDCFSQSILDRISSLDGRKVIYCDGGNKVKELRTYSPLCKPRDLIMCHDYWDRDRYLEDFPRYGIDLDSPKPEVLEEDVRFLDGSNDFCRLWIDDLYKTRICAWMRTDKNEQAKK